MTHSLVPCSGHSAPLPYFPLLLSVAFFSCCTRPPVLSSSPMRALASSLAGSDEAGGIRMIYGRTSCQSPYPNPIVLPPRVPPRQGRPIVVSWQLSVVPPSPKVVDPDGVVTPPVVSLLAATLPLTAPVASGSPAPGCWLLVMPEMLFVPQAGSWLVYDEAKGLVTATIEAPIGSVGQDVYLQLLVAYPDANALGMISSAGLHLHVGG